ncbi:MAG: hypothetical protein KGJ23_08270 [Euryarchaeota archaeon]|nr:hypothetical protein [Euryarchaeota archaeon]MDE1836597.1 hypothetical protein [Euryarchaeota archaeon]MDE1879208.1 hypothetical protein [Euryarchaeota archaeon]MDE2044567.1 hypothetical protein [Thermoplasmata archaeon]
MESAHPVHDCTGHPACDACWLSLGPALIHAPGMGVSAQQCECRKCPNYGVSAVEAMQRALR